MAGNRFAGLYITTFLAFISTVVLSTVNLTAAGITAISAIVIYRKTLSIANKQGRDRYTKVSLILQENILFLGLVATAATIPTVPLYLSVISLFSFSLLLLTKLGIRNQLNKTYKLSFESVELGLIASITLLISGLNPHFGFWGVLLIVIVAVYQEAELIIKATDLKKQF